MDADNLDRLLKQYITHLRMKSSENKIFSNHNKLNNGELLRKLGIESTGNHIANCERIIRKLIKDYNYFGEYTLGTINAYLSIYDNAQKGSIPDNIKLQDLCKEGLTDNDLINELMERLQHGYRYYYITQDTFNHMQTKKYQQELNKRVSVVEQQRLQRIEEMKHQMEQQEQQRLL